MPHSLIAHGGTSGGTGFPARRRTGKSGPLRGFTLVELLLVLVILAVLAAVIIPKFAGRSEQARITAAQTQLAAFRTALDAFEIDNGYYPKGQDGLIELVEEPQNARNWRGPYLTEIPLDPWGSPYIYEYPGRYNQRGYDLSSMGPDGRAGGDDDIVNWRVNVR